MMKNFFIAIFLLMGFSMFSQTYPEIILPGEQKTIDSKADTLWILKDSQLKKAIIAAKKLKLEEELTLELRKKVSLLDKKYLVQDSIIIDLKKDRDYYMNNWKDCTKDVDLLLRKYKRQKIFTRLSLGGVAVAFIVGFFIGK